MNCPELNYCRLCAKLKPSDKLKDLLSDDGKHSIVQKLIHVNAAIDSFDETLPKTVCFMCFELLDQAFDFVIQVARAQDLLRDHFLLQNVKNEDKVSDVDDISNVGNEEVSIKEEVVGEVCETSTSVAEEEPNETPIKSKCSSTWRDFVCICAICDTQFQNITHLRDHSMSFHSKCNSYRCIDCRKRKLNIDQFVTHVSTHRKHLRRSCYQCLQTFKNVNMLKQHGQIHLSSNFVCRGCNISFKSEEELKLHKEKYYATHKVRIIPEKLKQTSLTCKVCSKTLKSKATLITHLLTHTNRTCKLVCEICGKQCLRKYEFDMHMLTHSEYRPYECKICNSTFKTKSGLQVHYSLHKKIKPYTCKVCGKQFRLRSQVNKHQVVHTDTYPYNCEVCGKGFNFKNRLQVHQRQHSGAMPYSCDICNRAFRDWSNYAKHMKVMHNKNISKKKHNVTDVPIELIESKRPGRPKLKNSINHVSIQAEERIT
ncbi:hypothetical protein K1T71_014307 [Dendrolimus kikuchii]|uniref:Uncharacterized protein n=1 Tax=Dendrolimus kikuchii TaxID=765133 RepID=A0ACC1CFX8_9NEOP|nr:hypothetical protein K1T71_014307 [Dendrolimus kikuchii]